MLNMAQLLSRSLTENIRLQTRLPPAPLHAFVAPHQLENALLNLALNARDAMPDGGSLMIAIGERHIPESLAMLVELPAGDYVQIDVTDTGSGIDAKLLPRLFEPFFTTKPFGQGSGLGLAMVYGFVRQSGGNIRIRSTPGSGTTVTFVLPRTVAPTPAAPVKGASTVRRGRQNAGPVLLVEDDSEVRRVIRLQLTALGHSVIEAADGVEAWSLIESVPEIAVLVTDTVMPGAIGGRELVARSRALRPRLPILMITGYASDNALAGTAQLDVPVLRKPFDQNTLATSLAAILDVPATTEDLPPDERQRACDAAYPGSRGRSGHRPPDLRRARRLRLPQRTRRDRSRTARPRAEGFPRPGDRRPRPTGHGRHAGRARTAGRQPVRGADPHRPQRRHRPRPRTRARRRRLPRQAVRTARTRRPCALDPAPLPARCLTRSGRG
ncbi:Sensory box histidine kinase/response regulator, C-terminal part [Aromatoleum aromaticum EbN1]|uniref:histidine kinase n=1 Tax=Aromatoleum aromaticum (strain DSM 19018 / LMG 30748 / EbN1) TaxID=76114 RepID=Q5P371_AROAE|nr:Sensory box histidine kinase/response regulator, C-terminal part [Aromatoleum aromaticum EbN1]